MPVAILAIAKLRVCIVKQQRGVLTTGHGDSHTGGTITHLQMRKNKRLHMHTCLLMHRYLLNKEG